LSIQTNFHFHFSYKASSLVDGFNLHTQTLNFIFELLNSLG